MGTAYRSRSLRIHTKSTEINAEQAHNRDILVSALKQMDFANYPYEWWHHSYGDRLWAAYKHHRKCFYGMPGNNEFSNIRQNQQNDVSITFSVPKEKGISPYEKELVLNELRGSDTHALAKIACDIAWNDTLKLLLKSDEEKRDYERFLKAKAPNSLVRWYKIMANRQTAIEQAENILHKPFSSMSPTDKKELYTKINKKTIPLQDWHVNFSQLYPDLSNSYDNPEDAFYPSAQKYIINARKRRQPNANGFREGFWLSIRDKESNQLFGVMAISTKIIKGNLIGHSARFISPDIQRRGIAGTAGFVALDFMYKYLIDKEQPHLYDGDEKPLFATTCHPFNQASRCLQGHNGAKFSQYDEEHCKFQYTTKREQHEQRIAEAPSIAWTAVYKNKKISSKTGHYPLSVEPNNAVNPIRLFTIQPVTR